VSAPNYVETILRLWHSGMIPRGSVVHVEIEHDADCRMMTGAGICDCAPFVSVRREAA
jgi:hypothetical protein